MLPSKYNLYKIYGLLGENDEAAITKNEIINITENVTFNSKSTEVKKDGEFVKLNSKEMKLLKFFLQHPNELLIHDRIYDY